jgi:NAD(P)-dependent dehydrogenase (short-subunit alcohol dehydrogenase family)
VSSRGPADDKPLKKDHAATVENFERMMAVNVRSTMMCYKYAAKQMIAQGRGGRILGHKISYLRSATTLI